MARRKGKPRDLTKEHAWRRTLAEYARSGLSIPEFCRRQSLKPWAFRYWQRELARRDRQAGSLDSSQFRCPSSDRVPHTAYLPVQVVPDEVASFSQTPSVEIVLPNGTTVRVRRGFDSTTLHAVLAVLEGYRC